MSVAPLFDGSMPIRRKPSVTVVTNDLVVITRKQERQKNNNLWPSVVATTHFLSDFFRQKMDDREIKPKTSSNKLLFPM